MSTRYEEGTDPTRVMPNQNVKRPCIVLYWGTSYESTNLSWRSKERRLQLLQIRWTPTQENIYVDRHTHIYTWQNRCRRMNHKIERISPSPSKAASSTPIDFKKSRNNLVTFLPRAYCPFQRANLHLQTSYPNKSWDGQMKKFGWNHGHWAILKKDTGAAQDISYI